MFTQPIAAAGITIEDTDANGPNANGIIDGGHAAANKVHVNGSAG